VAMCGYVWLCVYEIERVCVSVREQVSKIEKQSLCEYVSVRELVSKRERECVCMCVCVCERASS
jgi:hypothetical protein